MSSQNTPSQFVYFQKIALSPNPIVKSNAVEAVEILGREGKWISEPVGNDNWEASVTAYSTAYMKTLKFFRGRNLIPSDIDEVPEHLKKEIEINGKKHTVITYDRWKGEWLPLNYINLMVGPHVRNKGAWMSLTMIKNQKKLPWKSYFATEIPACSVMGDNMYVSGVTTGVTMTLPTDPEKVRIFNFSYV